MKDGGKALEPAPPELAPAQTGVATEEKEPVHLRRPRSLRRLRLLHSTLGNAAVHRAARSLPRTEILGETRAPQKIAPSPPPHPPETTYHEIQKTDGPKKAASSKPQPELKPSAESKQAPDPKHASKPEHTIPPLTVARAESGGDTEEKDKKKPVKEKPAAKHGEKAKQPEAAVKAAEVLQAAPGASARGAVAAAPPVARASSGGAATPMAMPAADSDSAAEEAPADYEPGASEEHAPAVDQSPPSASEEEDVAKEAVESVPPSGSVESQTESEEPDTDEESETSGEMPATDRNAAMASLASGPRLAPSMGGGGESGSPIAEPRAAETPDVSKLDPESAMAAVGNLPPAQLSAALGGVSTAASTEVAKDRQNLAAHPPQMERPSGSPATQDAAAPDSETDADAEGSAETKVERVPTGPPVEIPPPPPDPPLPPPPTEDTEEPEDGGGLFSAIRILPVDDSALYEQVPQFSDAPLEGVSDTSEVHQQRGKIDQTATKSLKQGQIDSAVPMGESHIFPRVPRERLRGTAGVGRKSPAAPKLPGLETADPSREAASIIAQEQSGDEIREAAAQAREDMADRRREHDEKAADERGKSNQEIAGLVAENRKEQTGARGEALSDVSDLRNQWTKEQADIVEQGGQKADKAVSDAHTGIKDKREEANRKIATATTKGNEKAAEAREKAEKDVAEKKRKAEGESSGAWGWIKSKAKAAFNAIKGFIKRAFDLARRAVRALIDWAKKAITEAIEYARKAIVGLIHIAGDLLILAGDFILQNFPAARKKFRNYIKSRVKRAEKFVNELAERLKKDVQKALDKLGAVLDAALGFLENALLAAVDVVAKVVDAAISAAQAIVEALQAFAILVRDVSADPIQWIKNLGAGIVDGIKNHLWTALKEAVQSWFNGKLEEVLGLGKTIWDVLANGGLKIAEIGHMVWEALKEAIPSALIQILVEKLLSMLVPALGAIMAIVDALRAAWGTIKRILAAFDRFIAFLKAVREGNAGRPFAELVAAAAVAVIDFVANWLLKKLRGPASKVAGKLRALASRIVKGVKKAASRVGGAMKRAGAKIKAKFGKIKGRVFGKKKEKPHKVKTAKQKESDQKRLDRAARELTPKIGALLSRGVWRIRLAAQMAYWRVRYRLSSLRLEGEGGNLEIVARVNPSLVITREIVFRRGEELMRLVRGVGQKMLADNRTTQALAAIHAQRAAGAGTSPDSPIQLLHGTGFPAQAADISTRSGVPGSARAPWTKEHFEIGGIAGSELQTYTSGPGHIRTLKVGKYDQIVKQWNAIGAATGANQAQMARAMEDFIKTGKLDPRFAEHREHFAALARLSMGVEPGRSASQLVHGPALWRLMGADRLSAEEGLSGLNPMAPVGAVKSSSGLSENLGMGALREYKTPADRGRVDQMARTELELLTRIVAHELELEQPLLKNEDALNRLILEKMEAYLQRASWRSFGEGSS